MYGIIHGTNHHNIFTFTGIAVIGINRPKAKNSLSFGLIKVVCTGYTMILFICHISEESNDCALGYCKSSNCLPFRIPHR